MSDFESDGYLSKIQIYFPRIRKKWVYYNKY